MTLTVLEVDWAGPLPQPGDVLRAPVGAACYAIRRVAAKEGGRLSLVVTRRRTAAPTWGGTIFPWPKAGGQRP